MTFALPFIAIGASIAGAGVSAYGQYQQGLANQRTAYYNAAVAHNNAIMEGQKAERAAAAGTEAASRESMKSGARLGAIKAEQAANNIDVNSGSAVDVQASQRMLGKLSADTVMNDALTQVYGYRVAEQSYETQAQLDMMEGDQAKTSGMIGAAGTLLGGASSAADKWYSHSKGR